MANSTSMANMFARVPSCSSTTLASRGSRILKSYLQNGPAVRVHGDTGKRPKHHLTHQQVKDIVQYILNYTGNMTVCMYIHIITCMPYLLQRLMQWWFLDEFQGISDPISSSSPAAPLNATCGSCISKQPQWDRRSQCATPCSPSFGGSVPVGTTWSMVSSWVRSHNCTPD